MPTQWGVSPLGNLSEFQVPQFHTGEGLAAIMALRQRQLEQTQKAFTGAAEGIGEAMEQRRKDQMANALADQAASYYGIDVPQGEGLGSGELRLKMMDDLFRAKQAGEREPLQQKLLQARIARTEREPATGGRGGGGGEFETIWHNGVEYRKSATGRGWVPIKTEGGGAPGAAVKPRTQAQQDKLELEVATGRADAEKQKAENIKKQLPNVPYRFEAELNTKAKQLGVDPVTGEPITASAGGADKNLAPEYGVQPVKVTSQSERDALSPGTVYIAPDGSIHTKQ